MYQLHGFHFAQLLYYLEVRVIACAYRVKEEGGYCHPSHIAGCAAYCALLRLTRIKKCKVCHTPIIMN